MVQVTNRGRSKTVSPWGCCKGSDQSGAPAPRSVHAWTGGVWGDVSPSEAEKCIFETQFARDLVHIFWQHFTKKNF